MQPRSRREPPLEGGDNGTLFPMPEAERPPPKVKTPTTPVWTGNKVRLIERYLYYFVMITKGGIYIDGFAGPQDPDRPESWAATCHPRHED